MHYNIYCDESCHLENDGMPVMLIGSIWCPQGKVKEISKMIRQIKEDYRCRGEIKWMKISNSRLEFFKEIIKFFFSDQDLYFRCLIVRNKKYLNHSAFNKGSHDTFYYKMYFSMLKAILSPDNIYNVFLDVKDTRSYFKILELKNILCNNIYDFTGEMIANIQHIRSDESEILQIADLLMGAVCYHSRGLKSSQAKLEIIGEIKKQSKKTLNDSTSLYETKFNLFFFTPSLGCVEECHE
jgi:hypothetical protein